MVVGATWGWNARDGFVRTSTWNEITNNEATQGACVTCCTFQNEYMVQTFRSMLCQQEVGNEQ